MSNRTQITQILIKLLFLQTANNQTFMNAARFSNHKLECKINKQKQTINQMEELIKTIEKIIEKKQNASTDEKKNRKRNPTDAKKIVEQITNEKEKKQIDLDQFSINCLFEMIELIKQKIIKMKINMILVVLTTKDKN